MKIALIGYGKMGRAIEQILLTRNHEVIATFDHEGVDALRLKTADLAIEFTNPEVAASNIKLCIDHGIPVVCGTTGWLEHYEEVKTYCESNNGTMLCASNFSLGVNIFFELNSYLAKMMNQLDQYELSMKEVHHTQKLDAPSGTAITLAEDALIALDRKNSWVISPSSHPDEIEIQAERVGDTPGTHSIKYQSDIDTIEMTHTAHSRDGFALGAVLAAEFLEGKVGVYTMKNFLNLH